MNERKPTLGNLVGKDVLIRHPMFGSLWMLVREDDGTSVQGEVWDDSARGSALMADDYSGENVWMNFPKSCVKKVEGRP